MIYRDSTLEYSNHIEILGNVLFGLLSEALGLETKALENMECSKGHRLHCHYYPACPEPELAIGTMKHSDAGFLTILLQNQIVSGLQILCEGQWINILPVSGGLVVNIGDLLQVCINVYVSFLDFVSASKWEQETIILSFLCCICLDLVGV